MGSTIPPFSLKDSPIESSRKLKVRIIGAGFSGIYLGIRIPQRLRNIDLVIYEKNEGIGGTWWENRYPGAACDIPSHSYQYTFEPNPRWSAFYAPAEEICGYLTGVATKYGVQRYAKLSHKVQSCVWDEDVKRWLLKVTDIKTGDTVEDDADILIAARGTLNDIRWPNIRGFDTFKGEAMHSAAWNQKYDFKNKTIGVIGSGSSSIQIVPELQRIKGTKVSVFVRSKTWISNPFGDQAMVKLGLDPKTLDFSEKQQKHFQDNPEEYLKFRKIIEADGNTIHAISHKDSEIQKHAMKAFEAMMRERLAPKPEIADALIPSFGVGARRLTPGPGYLEALVQPNVDFITQRIDSIQPEGIVLENGQNVDVDVLVCATGFNTSTSPPFGVIGKNNVTLKERWTPFPETYLTMGIDGFPNYFMMLGPNSAVGSGSLTMIIETQGDYIVKCIRKLQKEDYQTMTPLGTRVKDFSEYASEYFKKTVYLDDCNSWYKSNGGTGDRITALWPGSTLHALEALRAPRWEDYEFESSESNRLKWLGNGWSETQLEGGGDPAWYLEPGAVSKPYSGKPEDGDEFKGRPFSH